MSGCYTCGGGMGKHDPVAHDQVPEHEHIDGSGEGYCSCGAELCSLPGCDAGCVHPNGWIERAELLELRRPSALAYLSGWWYMRPGESMDEHAARLKADPRWPL